MDVTLLFKACIKSVRTTNNFLNNETHIQKPDILKTKRTDPILQCAREIARKIKNFEEFLAENKSAYLNVIKYSSNTKPVNDLDKEKIDKATEEIIKACKNSVVNLRSEIRRRSNSEQLSLHYSNITNSLEKYLKDVSKMYAEMKAVRVKKVVETHKISKLELEKKISSEKIDSGNVKMKTEIETVNNDINSNDTVSNLSSEEMQMFESENDVLFMELNSVSDEVKQVQSKVVHITELQQLFTEKVLQQDKDIDRIATTVFAATDNIKLANEQIRNAIQRNAGLRIWLLFFLLVMSFSLLFLDWYND